MFQKYSKPTLIKMAVLVPLWVIIGFYAAELFVGIISGILWGLGAISFNQTLFLTIATTAVYVIAALVIIGVPWLITKKRESLAGLGWTRWPTWQDILMAPAGFVVYMIFTSILLAVAMQFLPWFDANQAQDVVFNPVGRQLELILTFLSLVVIAPLAEETLFRGYLYGRLKKYMPIWLAIFLTSTVFGLLHGAWNVAFDTFALSVILCILREVTGGLWASTLLHMLKNGIAFYLLFINR